MEQLSFFILALNARPTIGCESHLSPVEYTYSYLLSIFSFLAALLQIVSPYSVNTPALYPWDLLIIPFSVNCVINGPNLEVQQEGANGGIFPWFPSGAWRHPAQTLLNSGVDVFKFRSTD